MSEKFLPTEQATRLEVVQEPMTIQYGIVSKVETLRMSGDTFFTLQGNLILSDTDKGLPMAMNVPEALWRSVDCGEVLVFRLADIVQADEISFEPEGSG